MLNLTAFDILRWDSKEIIAVDSSPICIANTLRVDLITKRVTLSSSDKGVTKDPFCKGSDKLSTAVLWGMEDYDRTQSIGRNPSNRTIERSVAAGKHLRQARQKEPKDVM